jgi:hypothetical protein
LIINKKEALKKSLNFYTIYDSFDVLLIVKKLVYMANIKLIIK